jgi:hypothetical protein
MQDRTQAAWGRRFQVALIPGCPEADASTGRKHFFLKKEAKTFAHLTHALGKRARQICKSFLVLFCKKELLASSNCRIDRAALARA